MRRLLLVLSAALALAPAAHAGEQLDAAVRALASSPVYVAADAKPTLTSAEQRELRAAISSAGGGPVYVAVLPASARDEAGGDSGELVRRLGDQAHEPGTYAVVAGGQFRAASTSLPKGRAAELATEAFDAHHDEGLAATLVDFVHRVGESRSGGGAGDGGGSSGSGGLAFLGLLAAGGGLFAFSRRRRRRRELEAQMKELRRVADEDLVALGDDVRAIDIDIEMPGVDPKARDDLSVALDRYDRAEQAIERARRPEDFAAVSNALEEGRWAMESSKARLAGRTPPERRPPCFFDPRHGPSTRDVEWSPNGGQPRPVPACEADALRVESGEEPQTREILLGGRRMPYYAGPGWMSPYAGGWYGGFGGLGTGLFGGLLLGQMLGGGLGGWGPGTAYGDPGDGGGSDFGGFGGGDWGGGGFGGGGGGDFGGGGGDF
jgi:hypothetical protein